MEEVMEEELDEGLEKECFIKKQELPDDMLKMTAEEKLEVDTPIELGLTNEVYIPIKTDEEDDDEVFLEVEKANEIYIEDIEEEKRNHSTEGNVSCEILLEDQVENKVENKHSFGNNVSCEIEIPLEDEESSTEEENEETQIKNDTSKQKGQVIENIHVSENGYENGSTKVNGETNNNDFKETKLEIKKKTSCDPGNKYIRWNLFITAMLLFLIPLPLWLPYVIPKILAFRTLIVIQYILIFVWVSVVIFAWVRMWDLYRYQYDKREIPDIYHLVVISIYKEPLAVIEATLETLAAQSFAPKTCVTLSFEDRSDELDYKIEKVTEGYKGKFDDVLFTKHPFALPGEIPGKCSNANHGMRESIRILEERGINTDDILVTSSDADTKFHRNYLEALTKEYHEPNNGYPCIYQSPLFFNWGLDEACAVTRVTALVRSAAMLGALIPLSVAPFGIYSFSGKLLKDGQYTHTAYQMDDQTTFIRWMAITHKKIKMVMVPVATISGPTSGRVFEEEIHEWARQAKRWTIGIGEVFHFFIINIKNIPLKVVLTWPIVFLTCHVTLLCVSMLFSISLAVSLATTLHPIATVSVNLLLPQPIIQYISFLLIFLLDQVATQLVDPKPHERISYIRNLYQLLVTPIVLLGYAFVAVYALFELTVRGRNVCRHNPSRKTALSISSAVTPA